MGLTNIWNGRDSIGFDAGDANLYRYVRNAPTNGTDPTGLVVYAGPVSGRDIQTLLNGEKGPLTKYFNGLNGPSVPTVLIILPNGDYQVKLRNPADADRLERWAKMPWVPEHVREIVYGLTREGNDESANIVNVEWIGKKLSVTKSRSMGGVVSPNDDWKLAAALLGGRYVIQCYRVLKALRERQLEKEIAHHQWMAEWYRDRGNMEQAMAHLTEAQRLAQQLRRLQGN
jgi:hypothetical protein